MDCRLLIVPVLVGNARIPSKESLPDSLRSLVYLHAAEVRSGQSLTSNLEDLMLGLRMTLNSSPSGSGKVNSDFQIKKSRLESPRFSVTHTISRTVPDRSVIGWFRGIWCVFRLDGYKFALWKSMFSGKEEVYVNDKLVSNPATKKIFSLSHTHTILLANTEYAFQVTVHDLRKGIIVCTLSREGESLHGGAIEYKKKSGVFYTMLTWQGVVLSIIIISLLVGFDFLLPIWLLWLLFSFCTGSFLGALIPTILAQGWAIQDFRPPSGDLNIEP